MKTQSVTGQSKFEHTDAHGQPIAGVGRFMVAAGAVIEHRPTGKILLMRRQDNLHNGEWEICYGRIDQGEDVRMGLEREVAEETGLIDLIVVAQFSDWHIYRGQELPENEVIGLSFWCQTGQEEVQLSTEHSEYEWVNVDEALERVKVVGIIADLKKFQQFRSEWLELHQSQAKAARAMADYQNLVRRQQDDRGKLIALANENLIGDLLEPLEHLSLAADQIKDPGLQMVIKQFWTKLTEHGLTEINPLGDKFDVLTMEVVDHDQQGDVVVQVVKRGYRLGEHVIQHAKVILGKDSKKSPQEKSGN